MITDGNISENIYKLIELPLSELGYEVVRIRFGERGGSDMVLQIMIENKNESIVTIKDCEKASVNISAILDVEDIISSSYNLEVSSPGIDRPLTRLKDFSNSLGKKIKIELFEQIEGRKRFSGSVDKVEESNIFFKLDDQDEIISIKFGDMKKAKLVLEI